MPSGAIQNPDRLKRYLSSGHGQVSGWLERAALEVIPVLLQRQQAMGIWGSACEIGVHHGRLLILLQLLTSGKSVGWDLFERQDENVDKSGKGDREQALSNFKTHGDENRISLIQANSLSLTAADVIEACGGKPCVFSVDGGHTAEITESDLRLAASSLSDGGLVILDDCFNEAWPAVAEGALPLLKAQVLIPVVVAGNKTICTNNHQAAERYRTAFGLPTMLYWEREVLFCGATTRVVHTWEIGWWKMAKYRLLSRVKNLGGGARDPQAVSASS
jgi:hypothetical protein